MPNLTITCPSGLKGVVRGLTGRELNLFANQQETKRRKVTRQILNNCWVETVEVPKVYEGVIEPGGAINMDKVLMCDRFYALLQIRCATHGSKYNFKVQCTESSCRKRFEWGLDINGDLDVYELPDSSIEKIAEGDGIFEGEVDGVTFRYKLLYGKDEDTNIRQVDMAPDRQATTSLAMRLVEVETRDGRTLTENRDIQKWAESIDFGTSMDIVQVMDYADGGIETNIEVQCPHCGNLMDLSLPLGEDLWTPKRQRPSGGRKVRQRSQG